MTGGQQNLSKSPFPQGVVFFGNRFAIETTPQFLIHQDNPAGRREPADGTQSPCNGDRDQIPLSCHGFSRNRSIFLGNAKGLK
jgi:hypothetical protein